MLGFDTVQERKRSARMEQRIDPKDKEIIEQAAALQGVTASEFVLVHSVTAARETINKLGITALTLEDRDAFQRAFSDERVNAALIDVFALKRKVAGARK